MSGKNLSEDDINGIEKADSYTNSNTELILKDGKGDLSSDEKLIIDKKFFGNLPPRDGCVYSVSFTEYDKTQSIFRGFMIHFDHDIKMRAVDTNSSNRRFNFNDIKLAPKTYNVKYDGDFFVSKKEKFGDHICIIEDVKKIKTRLIKFFRIKERSITIIDFWDKYIHPIATSYLIDGTRSFDDVLDVSSTVYESEIKYEYNDGNFYDRLGISKTDDQLEIKKAYHKMSLRWHPDKNEKNTDSKKIFQEISEAYEVLSDELKKTEYDKFHMDNTENSDTNVEKSSGISKDDNINRNISIIDYLDGKFTDNIFIDFTKFLNKKIDNDKVQSLEMSTSILNLDEIKDNITSSLGGIKKKSVTYLKSEPGVAVSKFKIVGKKNELDKFKETMTNLDRTCSFLSVC